MSVYTLQQLNKLGESLGLIADDIAKRKEKARLRKQKAQQEQRDALLFSAFKQKLAEPLPKSFRPAIYRAKNLDEIQKALNALKIVAMNTNAKDRTEIQKQRLRTTGSRDKTREKWLKNYQKRNDAFQNALIELKTSLKFPDVYDETTRYMLKEKVKNAYGKAKTWNNLLNPNDQWPDTYEEYINRNKIKVTNPLKKKKYNADDLTNDLIPKQFK